MGIDHVHGLTDVACDDIVFDLLARPHASKVVGGEIGADVDVKVVFCIIDVGCQLGICEFILCSRLIWAAGAVGMAIGMVCVRSRVFGRGWEEVFDFNLHARVVAREWRCGEGMRLTCGSAVRGSGGCGGCGTESRLWRRAGGSVYSRRRIRGLRCGGGSRTCGQIGCIEVADDAVLCECDGGVGVAVMKEVVEHELAQVGGRGEVDIVRGC